MAVSQQLLVPAGIDFNLILNSAGYEQRFIWDHVDKFNYILHCILEQRIYNPSIGDGYSNLSMNALNEMLGKRYAQPFLKLLIDWGIIQCDYRKLYGDYGHKAYGYRISPTYRGRAILRDIFKVETFAAKLKKAAYIYKQKHSKTTTWKNLTKVGIKDKEAQAYVDDKLALSLVTLDQFSSQIQIIVDKSKTDSILSVYAQVFVEYGQIEDDFISSSIDFSSSLPNPSSPSTYSRIYSLIGVQLLKKALLDVNNQGITLEILLKSFLENKHQSDSRSIYKIANEEYFMEQPDPLSRVFTNISSLSTDIRAFLYKKDEAHATMVNMDIRNSQPYLLSLLLTQKYQGQTMPTDVAKYIDLTANGSFYEHVMGLMGQDLNTITSRSRGEFKKEFFGKIFFCKSHYTRLTTEGKTFKKHFPHILALIDHYKEQGHEQLAITMQRAEAKVILKTIGSQLQKRGIWYNTIHDSVVVMQVHQEEVKSLILQAFFDAVGVAPTVKPEVLAGETVVVPEVAQVETDDEIEARFIAKLEQQTSNLAFDFEERETLAVPSDDDFFGW
jgi:hypothetical protein